MEMACLMTTHTSEEIRGETQFHFCINLFILPFSLGKINHGLWNEKNQGAKGYFDTCSKKSQTFVGDGSDGKFLKTYESG